MTPSSSSPSIFVSDPRTKIFCQSCMFSFVFCGKGEMEGGGGGGNQTLCQLWC